MKKNYLKLMKVIGTMNSRDEVLLYLCNCENGYLVQKYDKNQIRFVPEDNYNDTLAVFFYEGRVDAVFQHERTFSGGYKTLQFYPHSHFSNKLKITRW